MNGSLKFFFLAFVVFGGILTSSAQGESVFVFQPNPKKTDDKITVTDARTQSGASEFQYDTIARQKSYDSALIVVAVRCVDRAFAQEIADILKLVRRTPGYENLPVEMVWADPDKGKIKTIIFSRGQPVETFTRDENDTAKIIEDTKVTVMKTLRSDYAALLNPTASKSAKLETQLTALDISGKAEKDLDSLLIKPLQKKIDDLTRSLKNAVRPISAEKTKTLHHILNLVKAHFDSEAVPPQLGRLSAAPLKRHLIKESVRNPNTLLSAAIDSFLNGKFKEIYDKASGWKLRYDAMDDKEMISDFRVKLLGESYKTIGNYVDALDDRVAFLSAKIANSDLKVKFLPSMRNVSKGKLSFLWENKVPKMDSASMELQCSPDPLKLGRIPIDLVPKIPMIFPREKQSEFAKSQRCDLLFKNETLRSFFVNSDTKVSEEFWVIDKLGLLLRFEKGEVYVYNAASGDKDEIPGYYSKNGNVILFGIPDRGLRFEGTFRKDEMDLIVIDDEKKQIKVIARVADEFDLDVLL